jgi:hypothetical protein
LQEDTSPNWTIGFKTFHVMDRRAEEYSVLRIYPHYIPPLFLSFSSVPYASLVFT